MEKLSVSKEFVLEAHKEACCEWKGKLEKEFPELFESKFKAGVWFCASRPGHKSDVVIARITHINGDECHYEMANRGTAYKAEDWCSNQYINHHCRLATPSEIEKHLIALAEKKGFKNGVKYIQPCGEVATISRWGKFRYDEGEDDSFGPYGEGWIYVKGRWSTIIEEPKTIEITIEEIAKLKGVDVSQIKIIK